MLARLLAKEFEPAKTLQTKLKPFAIANTSVISAADITTFAVQFPLLHLAVSSVMVGVTAEGGVPLTSIEQAREIVAVAEGVVSDRSGLKTY